MLGYMEQSVAVPIINSLTAVGSVKPKFPFLSSTQSALIYVALYLKAYNPKSSYYVRDVYQQKLKMFEEHCHLIAKLGKAMSNGYKEPQERPIDFEMNMNSFLSLIQSGSN
jgi:adenylate/nucleoside-diphosphate kinase